VNGPLAGFTVAVTADRRRDELANLLESQGARVVVAPTLRVVPPGEPAPIRTADSPPDLVLATAGLGRRGWTAVARHWTPVVTLRGHAVLADDALTPPSPGPMAVLRVRAGANGEVMSRTALRGVLPSGASEHAVDMAVLRLRIALGGTAFVETVPRRGYRLAID
jgi:DNA-binding response OmpR family regulator